MVEKMIEKLNSLAPMSGELSEKIRLLAVVESFNAGDIILKEGEVCRKASFIARGLTRSYYLNEDADITSRFMEEGSIVTAWISYYTQKPGNEFIEAVEDTTMVSLQYDDIQKLYALFPGFNTTVRKQVEYAFYLSEQRTQLLRKHTAEEKYKLFIQLHPSLMQRAQLKHIASYLGMNQETLSRVRASFAKRNS
jgi:CRP-like cAMP-binding protein